MNQNPESKNKVLQEENLVAQFHLHDMMNVWDFEEKCRYASLSKMKKKYIKICFYFLGNTFLEKGSALDENQSKQCLEGSTSLEKRSAENESKNGANENGACKWNEDEGRSIWAEAPNYFAKECRERMSFKIWK